MLFSLICGRKEKTKHPGYLCKRGLLRKWMVKRRGEGRRGYNREQ
jgi:hypothetical protein